MALGLVCDSSLNVPESFLEEYGIIEVPALVIFGPDEVYKNKVDISLETFYHRFLEKGEQPTTSQPTPAQFVEAYHQTGEKEILCVTVTSRLSGTYNSAVQAAKMVEEEGIRVSVWDTRLASMGGGWQMVHAARMVREGAPLDAILRVLEGVRERSFGFLTVETLTYLARAGRISATRAMLGNMLNIKPILAFQEGLLNAIGKERGRRKAKRTLVEHVRTFAAGRPVRVAAVHANIPDEAQELLDACKERVEVVESLVVEVGPVLAALAGPGLLGLAGYVVE